MLHNEAAMSERLIESRSDVMMGKPVVKGTRITVELILETLASGTSHEEILEEYPELSDEAIRAPLAFGAQALRADVVYPTPTA